jgi:hypothetical protein
MAHYLDCKKLKISDLLERNMFKDPKTVKWHWPQLFYHPTTEYLGDFAMVGVEDDNMIKIGHYVPGYDHLGEKKMVGYAVNIVSKPVYFGGCKYYFLCPLCRRMCSVLYKPDNHQCFGCNDCHDIRYPTQVVNSNHSSYGAIKRSMIEKKIEGLETSMVKKMYRGVPTRRSVKIEWLERQRDRWPNRFC